MEPAPTADLSPASLSITPVARAGNGNGTGRRLQIWKVYGDLALRAQADLAFALARRCMAVGHVSLSTGAYALGALSSNGIAEGGRRSRTAGAGSIYTQLERGGRPMHPRGRGLCRRAKGVAWRGGVAAKPLGYGRPLAVHQADPRPCAGPLFIEEEGQALVATTTKQQFAASSASGKDAAATHHGIRDRTERRAPRRPLPGHRPGLRPVWPPPSRALRGARTAGGAKASPQVSLLEFFPQGKRRSV
jgi:hypothetical protein